MAAEICCAKAVRIKLIDIQEAAVFIGGGPFSCKLLALSGVEASSKVRMLIILIAGRH